MAVLTFGYDNVASVLWTFVILLLLLLFLLRRRVSAALRRRRWSGRLGFQARAEAALHYRHHAVEFRINSLYLTEHLRGGGLTDGAAIAGDVANLAGGEDGWKASCVGAEAMVMLPL